MEFYVKVHKSMLLSSIWDEDDHTRIVWVTLLMMADQNGHVAASVTGIAHMARLTMEQTEAAMQRLMSPDPASRSKTDEGRRLVAADRGFTLVNYVAIKEGTDAQTEQRSDRMASRKQRAKKAAQAVESEQQTVPRQDIRSDQDQITSSLSTEQQASDRTVHRPEEVSEDVWHDWQKLRKAHRAPVTPTVLDMLRREAAKAGMGLQAVMQVCVLRGWRGFQAGWMQQQRQREPAKTGVASAAATRFITADGSPTVGDLSDYFRSKETKHDDVG